MGSVPAAIRTLREYYNTRSVTLSPVNLLSEMAPETDRSVVVIMGSLLEDQLTESIRTRLRPMTEDEEKDLRIFKYDGPFGGFSSKITVANAMGIIDDELTLQLDEIREMRNACAHSFRAINFETPELANVALRLFSGGRGFFPLQTRSPSLRMSFMIECATMLVAISHGSKAAAISFIEQELEMPPGSLTQKSPSQPSTPDPESRS